MIQNLQLDDFLKGNNIDPKTWEEARIEWPILQHIAVDHEEHLDQLGQSAELFARVTQKFDKVHSVRWRVKDTEHLLEKIVRKRAEGNEKYQDITPDNYFEVVTDLSGIRILHLFKEEYFEIHNELLSAWNPIETPIAYIRAGDREEWVARFDKKDFEVKEHPRGYRSIHYVFESKPLKRKCITEVQVRTIFEEGWSEIDHRIRYPNFSRNELVEYFLTILNRLAGSADEMGSFVGGLVVNLEQLQEQVAKERNEKEAILRDMEKTLDELEFVKEKGKESRESVEKLKAELARLKLASSVATTGGLFGLGSSDSNAKGLGLGTAPINLGATGTLGDLVRTQGLRGLLSGNEALTATGGLLSTAAALQGLEKLTLAKPLKDSEIAAGGIAQYLASQPNRTIKKSQ